MDIKSNLLKETKKKLSIHNKTPKDVLWIGTKDGSEAMNWGEFVKIADFEYDNGYGEAWIYLNLVVVGKGWWLERFEYDGSEWWEYKEPPKLLKNHKKLSYLTVVSLYG